MESKSFFFVAQVIFEGLPPQTFQELSRLFVVFVVLLLLVKDLASLFLMLALHAWSPECSIFQSHVLQVF